MRMLQRRVSAMVWFGEMWIMPVFRGERSCASAYPARLVPMIAIVWCFSFEVRETVVVV